ncbi:MAG: hypothetical protein QNJ45_16675 [Ardenticatenaceae bacterium]|nr:hypothetical protein [Ardenticatenaceae bacterium]
MSKNRIFSAFLLLALVMWISSLGLSPTVKAVAPSEKGDIAQLNVPLAPPMDNFLDIWVGDGVDNLASAVAYNSRHDEFLVVWENDRGATRDIYARRVASSGDILSWFTIVSNAGRWNYLPDVSYNPIQDEYLVVYTYQVTASDYDIWARRVKWDGSWMSPEIPINQDPAKQWYPAVAYNSRDNEYLVVYENYWAGGLRDIAAQRVAGNGSLLSWRNIATGPGTTRRLPDAAYNEVRNEYLIAYTYDFPTNGDIRGKITSFNLGLLGAEIDIVNNTNHQDDVALTAGPNEYLAIWEDGPMLSDRTIYGRRLTATGVLQSYIQIAAHTGESCVEPAVAYSDVYGYMISWRHISAMGDWDVFGRQIKAGHNLPADVEFPIDIGSDQQKSPVLACSPLGFCLLVEEDNYSPAGPIDYEIRGRLIQPNQLHLPMVRK